MGVVDIQKLLESINPDAPCGEDIEYDQAFLELTQAIQPSQTGVVGPEDEIHEPNWREVSQRCSELLQKSKHLRIILYMTLAALKLEGLSGLADGLSVLRGVLETYWDHLYPQLDPDDNLDPSERVNILIALSPPLESQQDPLAFIRPVQEAPLCQARQLGSYCFRDILIAQDRIPAPSGDNSTPANIDIINGAFAETPIEQLQETAQALQSAIDHVVTIESVLTEKMGAAQAPDLSDLSGLLKQISEFVREHLGADADSEQTLNADGAPQTGQSISGEISSREDARQMLDKICKYFEKHEPSSPIPLLIKRAQRLISKDFMEIIRDITPDSIQQIELLGGIDKEESS